LERLLEEAPKSENTKPDLFYTTRTGTLGQQAAAKIFTSLKMVSMKRFKNIMLTNKRLNSRMSYYQSVMRRDKYIIETLNTELAKFNKYVDLSHLRTPDFRVKKSEYPDDDLMHTIDADEAKAYRKLLNGKHVVCKADDLFESRILVPNGTSNGSVSVKRERPDTDSNCSSDLVDNTENCVVVRLEKVIVDEARMTSGKRKQVAMKSSSGGIKKFRKVATNGAQSSNHLEAAANLDGDAFLDLKAKFASYKKTRMKSGSPTKSMKTDPIPTKEKYKPKPARFKKKALMKAAGRKIPKELVDEPYAPPAGFSTTSPIKHATSNEQIVKDMVLYDDFVQLKNKTNEQAYKINEPKSISDGLKKKILSFLDDAITYDKGISIASNDGSSEDGGSIADSVEMCANNGSADRSSQNEGGVTGAPNSMARDQLAFILHKRFIASNREYCSLKSFAEMIPKAYGRKTTITRGFTNCMNCGTAELKFDSLVSNEDLDFEFDFSFDDIWLDQKKRSEVLSTILKTSKVKNSMSDLSWIKHNKTSFSKSIRSLPGSVENVCKTLSDEMSLMQNHLSQINSKYLLVRTALNRVLKKKDEAMVHISWAECPKVYHRSHNNHVMADQCISMLCGQIWTSRKEYSIACVSDVKDHSTSSMWTHLESPLLELVSQGIRTFYIVSEPTTTQFRNKALFYYMNEFAVKEDVEIRWIFTVSYHAHLKADFFAQRLKDMIEKKTLYFTQVDGDNPYRSAHSVVEMLKDEITDCQFYFIRSEDISTNIEGMPTLQSIKGTQAFAEVLIAPGKFYVKLNSDDEYWTKVLIIF